VMVQPLCGNSSRHLDVYTTDSALRACPGSELKQHRAAGCGPALGRPPGCRQRRHQLDNTGPALARFRGSMTAALLAVFLVLTLAVNPVAAQEIEIKLADEPDSGLRDMLLQAIVEDTGDQPIELRILRMTLEPGARSPWHAHPGLEFGVI